MGCRRFLKPTMNTHMEVNTNGKIAAEKLRKVEDDAIIDLISKQKAVGLQVITDGEFRRSSWHLDFMWAFNGVDARI